MDNDKLLKDARELADKIGHVDLSLIRCVTDSAMLRALADIVERQDKVIAKTVGACVVCDREMTEVLENVELVDQAVGTETREHWIGFRMARNLARRAARLGEPANEVKLMDGYPINNAADSLSLNEPVRPVEVEMQCIGGGNNWTWQCCLVGVWIVSQCYADDECEPVNYPTKQAARSNGKRWLTALADQLDVPLVGVWKDGE